MSDNQSSIDEMIKNLKEDDNQNIVKKWNEDLISKFILLLPLLIFLVTFLKFNKDKSIYDLIIFLSISIFLIILGILFNILLQKRK
tara:strand:+ start:1412 stop:1669 length:258 start_codon:yes stop_codon:yes gene_type:complete